MEADKCIPKFSTLEDYWWDSDVEYSFVDFPPADSTANSNDKEAEPRGANTDPI